MRNSPVIKAVIIFMMFMTGTLVGCNRKESSSVSTHPVTRYSTGQVWRYKTRPDERQSFLRVLKVEEDSILGVVIHIAVEQVHIKNPRATSGFSERLPHLPLSAAAMDSSVLMMIEENAAVPDFQAGYGAWKQAKGGIFTTTVAEAIDYVEKAINK